MQCERCKRGVEGAHLHRQNEKGVKGVWRCEDCNTLPVDPTVQLICDLVGGKTKKKE